MAERTVQLVLHYDGARCSGWQRQPDQRTVQGVVEQALERLCGGPIPALGSGRTDAGVHARGQAVGVRLPERWDAVRVRRALNAILPDDVWVATSFEMRMARGGERVGNVDSERRAPRVGPGEVATTQLHPFEARQRVPRRRLREIVGTGDPEQQGTERARSVVAGVRSAVLERGPAPHGRLRLASPS